MRKYVVILVVLCLCSFRLQADEEPASPLDELQNAHIESSDWELLGYLQMEVIFPGVGITFRKYEISPGQNIGGLNIGFEANLSSFFLFVFPCFKTSVAMLFHTSPESRNRWYIGIGAGVNWLPDDRTYMPGLYIPVFVGWHNKLFIDFACEATWMSDGVWPLPTLRVGTSF